MAIKTQHASVEFGVGDTVRVWQKIQEADKTRLQAFEGMVIGIKGAGNGKSFVVRRVGEAKIGIEKIFPLSSPMIDKVEVVRTGVAGTKHAKLYFTRRKAKREVEEIYARASKRTGKKK